MLLKEIITHKLPLPLHTHKDEKKSQEFEMPLKKQYVGFQKQSQAKQKQIG